MSVEEPVPTPAAAPMAVAPDPSPSTPETILAVENLEVSFLSETKATRVVRGIDIEVGAGESVALVGESGSGKSASVLGLLDLLPAGAARVDADRIAFNVDGRMVDDPWAYLGSRVGVVFQDPQSCLNPTMRVGKQIGEVVRQHEERSRSEVRELVLNALDEVGIPDPVKSASSYPHQLSGGMRQRVMIAMATISRPSLLVADEPTTALDTTLQSQIIDTILDRQRTDGAGLLFITHDLALVSGFADRILVMYAGKVVESGPALDLINAPVHPYTRALLASVPKIGGDPVRPIRGAPPFAGLYPKGCSFHPRCDHARPECTETPPRIEVGDGHSALCWFADEFAENG